MSDLIPGCKNFTEKEAVDPLYDGNPANTWGEQPKHIQENLIHTFEVVQAVRTEFGIPMRINSTWRPLRDEDSPHYAGKAIDTQFLTKDNSIYIKVMDWLREECPLTGFRVYLEWQGNNPWLHFDRRHKDYGKKLFRVGYPQNNDMVYAPYEGKLPQQHIK